MTIQLRMDKINRGSLQVFAKEWKEKVLPLRMKHGFQIHGAWTIEETNQFAWLISYEGRESWETKESAYYSSINRKTMEPNPARLISRSEQYYVDSIL